jgi:uncharacterized protein
MPDKKPSREPSTEEIIASISRLIAEDGGGREPVLGPLSEKDDVLELTARIDDDNARPIVDPPAGRADPVAAPRKNVSPSDGRPPLVGGEKRVTDPDANRLLSETASQAATSAFARLGALSDERHAGAELPVGGSGRTVEDLVEDVLRPLLRSWLDAHLPSIVERLVREEIARVAGGAGLR